jgi:hypothetical protein
LLERRTGGKPVASKRFEDATCSTIGGKDVSEHCSVSKRNREAFTDVGYQVLESVITGLISHKDAMEVLQLFRILIENGKIPESQHFKLKDRMKRLGIDPTRLDWSKHPSDRYEKKHAKNKKGR